MVDEQKGAWDPTQWQASFSAGNMSEALAKANVLKGQAAEIMTRLGMQVPTALKS